MDYTDHEMLKLFQVFKKLAEESKDVSSLEISTEGYIRVWLFDGNDCNEFSFAYQAIEWINNQLGRI